MYGSNTKNSQFSAYAGFANIAKRKRAIIRIAVFSYYQRKYVERASNLRLSVGDANAAVKDLGVELRAPDFGSLGPAHDVPAFVVFHRFGFYLEAFVAFFFERLSLSLP